VNKKLVIGGTRIALIEYRDGCISSKHRFCPDMSRMDVPNSYSVRESLIAAIEFFFLVVSAIRRAIEGGTLSS
jgi:hypothetical protein